MSLLLAALTLAGCSGEPSDTAPCTREPALNWQNFGQPFMQAYCDSCHSSLLREDQRQGAPMGIDLDSYADAVRWAPRIRARVLLPEPPEMPPGGGPTTDELALLDEWLSCAVEAE